MYPCELRRKIREIVLFSIYEHIGIRYVPVAISNRHVHLSKQDIDTLFGKDYKFEFLRSLTQPGQFAVKETVSIIGPKGRIDGVRILLPERSETQVELSVTDSFVLGVDAVLRMSGNVKGSPSVELVADKGSVTLREGAIVAARHLHLSDKQAELYKLRNGERVSLRKTGDRGVILNNVVVRSGAEHELEVHLDTDEANSALIKADDILEIVEG
jgi:putative phosphotransacetylase